MKLTNHFVALLLGVLALSWALPALAHQHEKPSMAAMVKTMGWDLEKAEIRSEKVGDNLYVLFGLGGNIGVSIGKQGTLIVDDQFPELKPKIDASIKKLGGGDVQFAINTHWHFDHAQGNLAYGPGGTWLVSQAKSRDMMTRDQSINFGTAIFPQAAYPADALPVITFDDRMQFHFNDETIDLLHFGPAHTTGDTAVIFRTSNAVHMGDVFNNSGYPFIDADNGGDLAGMIAFCKAVLAQINTDTAVIPGHGEVTSFEAMQNYVAMLEAVHTRVVALVRAGKSLEEVIAAKPTKEFDAEFKSEMTSPDGFVNRVYASVKRELGQ